MKITFSIAPASEGFGVPYSANTSDNSKNNGYIDLKKSPHRIGQIHELDGWPELHGFITQLSTSTGFFRTLRTDAWVLENSGTESKHTFKSYITICFEAVQLNGGEENFRRLYDEFVKSVQDFPCPDETEIHFVLIPTSYNYFSYRGWCLDLWVVSAAANKARALETWSQSLDMLKRFFIKESRMNEKWLPSLGHMLSQMTDDD